MNNVIIGTAGHVDHGKTCLIKELTGTDTDRLKEEQQRGITIELGFANMKTEEGENIGIIDVPGHEKFIRNMLSGIGGIDICLMVIAADEGVMPQTKEHLDILTTLKIKKGVIALTKADLADEDWIEAVKEDIQNTVKETFLSEAEIIEVSAKTGKNIDRLRQKLFELAKEVQEKRTAPEIFRIPVDRVFTIDGFGTVATGTLTEGSICEGDEFEIYPSRIRTKVRNLQVHGKKTSKAMAGQRTAVNISGIKKEKIKKGDVLAAPGSMVNTMMLDTEINMFKSSKRSIKNGSRVHFHYGSAEVLCKVVLLDKDELGPGETGLAQMRFDEELALKRGDRFVVRFYSPVESIGGGTVLDPYPEKHKRKNKKTLEAMHIKAEGNDEAILLQIIKENSGRFYTKDELRTIAGFGKDEMAYLVEDLIKERRIIKLENDSYIHEDFALHMEAAAGKILKKYHSDNPIAKGMDKNEFREKLASALYTDKEKSSEALLKLLTERKKIENRGNSVAISGFSIKYTKEQKETREQIEKYCLGSGFEARDMEAFAAGRKDEKHFKQITEDMVSEGILVKLNYRYYMHSKAWEKAMDLFHEHMKDNDSITLAQMRDILGSSRKYTVLILEALDEMKITRLVGDARVLRRS